MDDRLKRIRGCARCPGQRRDGAGVVLAGGTQRVVNEDRLFARWRGGDGRVIDLGHRYAGHQLTSISAEFVPTEIAPPASTTIVCANRAWRLSGIVNVSVERTRVGTMLSVAPPPLPVLAPIIVTPPSIDVKTYRVK